MIGSTRVSSRAADALGCIEPVHAWQHPVEDDETKRIRAAGAIVLFEQRKPVLGASHRDRRDGPASEQRLEQFTARRGVLHDEHRALGDARGRDTCGQVFSRLGRQAGGEEERRADAGSTFEGQVAAHEAGQPAADHQPEPGAAVLPCRRAVGLRERLKQSALLLRRDSDAGVAHT